jgi:excinuclease UvrABC nuclease subunit
MELANRNLQFDEAANIKEEIEKIKKVAKKWFFCYILFDLLN